MAWRVKTERWQVLSETVIGTTTGVLSDEARLWLGVLHGGEGALITGVHAAALAGLKNWDRETVLVLVAHRSRMTPPLRGFTFVQSRRALAPLRARGAGVPRARPAVAVLQFASRERNQRVRDGILAAAVQQQIVTAEDLLTTLSALGRIRWKVTMRETLRAIGGGVHSVAELDLGRLCRAVGLAPPKRQVRRRDAEGRLRYTDAEWDLPDGRTLVLEVDGLFHMDVEHWEDDLARQRALSSPDVVVVRCTSREVRDEKRRLGADLIRLGVPRAA